MFVSFFFFLLFVFVMIPLLMFFFSFLPPPALSADPLLVWNYGVMGVLALITGFVFWWSVRDLDTKEDTLNNLAEGHLGIRTVGSDGLGLAPA